MQKKRRYPLEIAFFQVHSLERLNILSLPSFGTLGHIELDSLAFLKALETAGLDRREMHKNIFAILTADKAVTLGIIKPLHCSLFHILYLFPLVLVTLEGVGRNLRRLLAVKARTAHDRFGLTHVTHITRNRRD